MATFVKTFCGNPAVERKDKNNRDERIEKKKLVVNEIFGPTIQGEGKTAGKKTMFLRTSGCNLACNWCDTPYTWNWKGTKFLHPDKFDKKLETHQMTIEEIKNKLYELGPKLQSLVISGGEPMLQQKNLIPLLEALKEDNYWIEIETNGTVEPDDNFLELIDQINCSPKLLTSGLDNTLEKREKPDALEMLARCEKTNFKFVVTKEEDLIEIKYLVERYDMKEVYLMPEGRTKEEVLAKQKMINKLAKDYKFKSTRRLHIERWGPKRAV